MKERYLYTCMECSFEWESSEEDETLCPVCGVGDIHIENLQDDEK